MFFAKFLALTISMLLFTSCDQPDFETDAEVVEMESAFKTAVGPASEVVTSQDDLGIEVTGDLPVGADGLDSYLFYPKHPDLERYGYLYQSSPIICDDVSLLDQALTEVGEPILLKPKNAKDHYLCVFGVDAAGDKLRPFEYSWSEEDNGPAFGFLGPNSGIATNSWLKIFVESEAAESYQFELGTNCEDIGFTSEERSLFEPIFLQGADLEKQSLCVRVKAGGGYSFPLEYQWSYAGDLPEIAVDSFPEDGLLPKPEYTINITNTAEIVTYSYKVISGVADCQNLNLVASFPSVKGLAFSGGTERGYQTLCLQGAAQDGSKSPMLTYTFFQKGAGEKLSVTGFPEGEVINLASITLSFSGDRLISYRHRLLPQSSVDCSTVAFEVEPKPLSESLVLSPALGLNTICIEALSADGVEEVFSKSWTRNL